MGSTRAKFIAILVECSVGIAAASANAATPKRVKVTGEIVDTTANMSGNLIPQEMAVISTPWTRWDHAVACREAWLTNLPMLQFTYSAINPVAVKSLMQAVGLPAGPLRKPLKPIAPDHLARGLAICRDLGLDKKYGYTLSPLRSAAE